MMDIETYKHSMGCTYELRSSRKQNNPPEKEPERPEAAQVQPQAQPLKRRKLLLEEKSQIFLMSTDGKSKASIAKDTGRSPNVIRNFLHNVAVTHSFQEQHYKKGRYAKGTTKLTERQQSLVREWLRTGQAKSSRQAWIRLSGLKNVPRVCYNVVNNYVKSLGQWRNPRLQTVISAENKVLRVAHCTQYQNHDFERVLFTDESQFQLNANTLKVFWFKGDDQPTTTKHNPNYSFMVWGGISKQGKTPLVFYEDITKSNTYKQLLAKYGEEARKTVDSIKYQAVLMEHKREIKAIFGRRTWSFQQDNAKPHIKPETLSCIRSNLTRKLFSHPAQSPDLNPMELVWPRMKRLVELSRPKNKRQLRSCVEAAWNKVGIRLMKNIINDLPTRMAKVIQLNGELLN